MEFYKLWRGRGGTVGVNKMSLVDMAQVELLIIVMYVVLLGLFVTALPTILFVFYIAWMVTSNGGEGNDGRASEQRLIINILTVISSIFFLLDFHFGWVSYHLLGSVLSKESHDAFAIYNTSIGIISIIFFFVGHELYWLGKVWVVRILIFLTFTFFMFKFSKPISTYIVKNVITQCSDIEAVNQIRRDAIEREQYEYNQ